MNLGPTTDVSKRIIFARGISSARILGGSVKVASVRESERFEGENACKSRGDACASAKGEADEKGRDLCPTSGTTASRPSEN